MKRALIFILCILICLSSWLLAGCTANNDKKDETTTVPAATDTDPYSDDLPARMDYDKQVINVLCRDSYGVRDELAVNAEDMGNTVSALVYNRNLSVADRMNIVINPILIPDDPTNSWRTSSLKVQNSVLAGDNSYDIASMNFNTFIMAQGYFKDLNNIDSIDLDKYYWSHNFNDCFQIAGAQYCATGMAALSFYRYMYVMAYNEELLEQQKIDSLFDLVKSGEWTMEKLYTMTVDVYENRNSNDSKDASDFYGFVSGARTSIDAYWVSLNMTVLSKNSDGLFDLSIPLERVSNGTDAVIKQFWLNTGSYIVPTGDDNFDNEKICDIFVDSRA
ncbi:MAG: hypothetical protein ACI3XQ_05965, partial [Eubacteriales bacterium]